MALGGRSERWLADKVTLFSFTYPTCFFSLDSLLHTSAYEL